MASVICFVTGFMPDAKRNGLPYMASLIYPGAFDILQKKHDDHDLADVLSRYTEIRLVGHSFGGNASVDACGFLGNKPVAKLVLLDPVPYGWKTDGKFVLSRNVQAALCLLKGGGLPPSCKIQNKGDAYTNHVIHGDHGSYPWIPEVRRQTLDFLGVPHKAG